MKKTLLAVSLLVPGLALAQAPVSGLSSSGDVEKRLEQIERMLEARSSAQLNMMDQLNSVQQDVAELRGITEEHAYQLEQLLQRQRELYQEIDRRFSQLKDNNSQSNNAGAGYSDMQQVPTQTDAAVIQRAWAKMMSDKAIALVLETSVMTLPFRLSVLLESFPNSTYVPNAHYIWEDLLSKSMISRTAVHDGSWRLSG